MKIEGYLVFVFTPWYSGSIGLHHEMTTIGSTLTGFAWVSTRELVMASLFTVRAFNFIVFR